MTTAELLALIVQGEGETLEFKQSVAELDKAVEAVTAFANTRGGTVLIGVRPDGQVEGLALGHTTRERIANCVTGNTDPAIYPSVEFVPMQGRAVAVVTVPESDSKPHLASGRAFKRVGAITVQMRRDEYERLLLVRRQTPFDGRELPQATLDDVDEAKVQWYLQRARQERNIPVDPTLPILENLKRLQRSSCARTRQMSLRRANATFLWTGLPARRT